NGLGDVRIWQTESLLGQSAEFRDQIAVGKLATAKRSHDLAAEDGHRLGVVLGFECIHGPCSFAPVHPAFDYRCPHWPKRGRDHQWWAGVALGLAVADALSRCLPPHAARAAPANARTATCRREKVSGHLRTSGNRRPPRTSSDQRSMVTQPPAAVAPTIRNGLVRRRTLAGLIRSSPNSARACAMADAEYRRRARIAPGTTSMTAS